MFLMKEPIRGQNLLKILNNSMAKSVFLIKYMPLFADIFVFTYPVYLIILYLYGIFKKDKIFKEFGLLLFVAGGFSMLVNLIIKFFVEKTRPDVVLDLVIKTRDSLVLDNIPKDTFPSDHIAMATTIAFVSFIWGIQHKNKVIKYLSIMFLLFVIIMGYARISIGVHWPTDILAGFGVGVLVAFIFTRLKIQNILAKYIFSWIIIFEEWFFSLFINFKKNR